MFRSTAGGAALALALAGCSGLAPKDPDPTPLHPTAVLETHMVNEGIKAFPEFESTTRTYTRPNMQRSESTASGVGTFARFLGGASTDARIERVDRKLAWTLDAKNKQYAECPLKGCINPVPRKPAEKKSTDEDHESACRLKTGTSTVTIEATGLKRSINGFDAEQYDVRWLVTFRDNASRKSTSMVSIDLWTTPLTPVLKDAMALEKAYVRARDKILGTETDADRMTVLPPEVGRMISSYLAPSVSPTDRAAYLAGAKKLDKVKGQPVLINVKWSFSGEACSMDETMKNAGDKPLLTFMSEIRSYKLESLHDSLFAPPKDYKRTK